MRRSLIYTLHAVCGALTGNRGRNLGRREAQEAFEGILDGEGTLAQVAALFVGLRSRGTTADELAGFAQASRERIAFPNIPQDAVVIATSRTGKWDSPPMGLASAATAAACGVPVLIQAAPHAHGAGLTLGDVWTGLVGELTGDARRVEAELGEHGLACWRPTEADPAWARLLEVEEEIALRSVPDIVTKLLAPPGARLVVAAMAGPVLGTAGDALAMLGHRHAMIVQGVEGSIDPSLTQLTRGMLIEDGSKSPLRIQPMDLGLACESEAGFLHEDRLEAARSAMMEAFMGSPGPNVHAVLMGSALLIRLSGRARDLASAIGTARDALESGRAQALFDTLRTAGGRS